MGKQSPEQQRLQELEELARKIGEINGPESAARSEILARSQMFRSSRQRSDDPYDTPEAWQAVSRGFQNAGKSPRR